MIQQSSKQNTTRPSSPVKSPEKSFNETLRGLSSPGVVTSSGRKKKTFQIEDSNEGVPGCSGDEWGEGSNDVSKRDRFGVTGSDDEKRCADEEGMSDSSTSGDDGDPMGILDQLV